MSKKSTFFEALALVAGTKKRIKQKGGDWVTYVYNDIEAGRGSLEHEGGKLYWPTFYEQKGEIWEVEPEEVFVWWNGAGGFRYIEPNDKSYKKHRLVRVDDE